MRLLIKLLMISIVVGFTSGCSKPPPERPVLPICVIDYPADEAICGVIDPGKIRTFQDLRGRSGIEFLLRYSLGPTKRVPLRVLDHAVALEPVSWKLLMNYLWEVEKAARRDCKISK